MFTKVLLKNERFPCLREHNSVLIMTSIVVLVTSRVYRQMRNLHKLRGPLPKQQSKWDNHMFLIENMSTFCLQRLYKQQKFSCSYCSLEKMRKTGKHARQTNKNNFCCSPILLLLYSTPVFAFYESVKVVGGTWPRFIV